MDTDIMDVVVDVVVVATLVATVTNNSSTQPIGLACKALELFASRL